MQEVVREGGRDRVGIQMGDTVAETLEQCGGLQSVITNLPDCSPDSANG